MTTTPAIFQKSDGEAGYVVCVDAVRLVDVASLKDGLLMLALAHYILNIRVRRGTKNLMWFMTSKVMKIPHEAKGDSNVVKDIDRLQAC